MYPVTAGANVGTTFTTVFAAFAVVGADARIGLQTAFVHLLYNVLAILVIYVLPVLRPVLRLTDPSGSLHREHLAGVGRYGRANRRHSIIIPTRPSD